MNKKANCNNCGQKIAFDASMANSLIACPSCGVETKLTEADYHPEPKKTEKTVHKAKVQVASGSQIRVGAKNQGDSTKTPRKTNVGPSNVANKINPRFGNSKNVRQAGWVMTVFGSITFMSNIMQYLALHQKHQKIWEDLSSTNILIGIRIDNCFSHCVLGLIIAGFGALLLELKHIHKSN
jgi:DNA-directed RNA polymerase subunit M/transcription elongation factor TFIIS